VVGQWPERNAQGRIAATLEWAKELTAEDVKPLKGQAAYSEKVPDPDQGFTQDDLKDPKNAERGKGQILHLTNPMGEPLLPNRLALS
jgi:hypothetical protein